MGAVDVTQPPRTALGRFARHKGPLAIRMLAKIERMELELAPGLGPCWAWTGARNGHGYGVIRDDQNRIKLAHRVSLALSLGRDLSPGMLANHRCGNKWCVRPRHLYEGTYKENDADWRRALGQFQVDRANAKEAVDERAQ